MRDQPVRPEVGLAKRQHFDGSVDWLPDDEVPSAVPMLLTGALSTFSPLPFKPLAGPIAVSAVLRRFDMPLSLTVSLTDDELAAVEHTVGIQDLVLNLKLLVTLLRSDPAIQPVMDTEMTIRVKHARWLQLLERGCRSRDHPPSTKSTYRRTGLSR